VAAVRQRRWRRMKKKMKKRKKKKKKRSLLYLELEESALCPKGLETMPPPKRRASAKNSRRERRTPWLQPPRSSERGRQRLRVKVGSYAKLALSTTNHVATARRDQSRKEV